MNIAAKASIEHVNSLLKFCNQSYRIEPKQARLAAEEACKYSELLSDKTYLARSLAALGIWHAYNGDFYQSEKILSRALIVLPAKDDPIQRAKILHTIGGIYVDIGDNAKALQIFLGNLKLFEMHDKKEFAANTLNHIGKIYGTIGEYSKAIEVFHKSLSYWETVNDYISIAICYHNIGTIYSMSEDNNSSVSYFEKSIKFSDCAGEKLCKAKSLDALADIYSTMKDVDTAYVYLCNALDIFLDLDLKIYMASVTNSIGNIHKCKKEYNLALDKYHETLCILTNTNEKNTLAIVYNNIGNIHLLLSDYTKSEEYIRYAIDIAQNICSKKIQYESYLLLSELYERKGDHKKAFESYKTYSTIRENVIGAEKQNDLRNAFIRLETGRLQMEKEMLDKEVHLKHKELAAHALRIVQKSDSIKHIKDKVRTILRDKKSSKIEALQELLRFLNKASSHEEDWHLFEEQYDANQLQFVERITRQYPSLSPMEVKVCLLLRLNLSSKDISRLLCISLRTVESHRYSIRKKLDINTIHSLTSFLSAL